MSASPRSDPVRSISYFRNVDTDDDNAKSNHTNFAIVTSRGVSRQNDRRLSGRITYCANREKNPFPISIVDSFNAPCNSSVWKAQSPTNKSKIRQWVERRYYQSEVTWGYTSSRPAKKSLSNKRGPKHVPVA